MDQVRKQGDKREQELTMPLNPQETVYLTNAEWAFLGSLSLERIEGDRVFGRFVPGEDFAPLYELLGQFETAVDEQLFDDADQLREQIDSLGLGLTDSEGTEQLAVCDVQVMEASAFSCRVPNLALTQLPRAVD